MDLIFLGQRNILKEYNVKERWLDQQSVSAAEKEQDLSHAAPIVKSLRYWYLSLAYHITTLGCMIIILSEFPLIIIY